MHTERAAASFLAHIYRAATSKSASNLYAMIFFCLAPRHLDAEMDVHRHRTSAFDELIVAAPLLAAVGLDQIELAAVDQPVVLPPGLAMRALISVRLSKPWRSYAGTFRVYERVPPQSPQKYLRVY